MKSIALRIVVLWVAAVATASAQTTHLNQPINNLVRIVFAQKSGDPKGVYRSMLAQLGDDTFVSDWQVPVGMTLVITDISLPGTNDGNPKPVEGLFWIFGWEAANPASQFENFRLPVTVRVEAATALTVLSRSLTTGLVFTHDWQPGIRDLLNNPNQADITLAIVRPTVLGYLLPSK